VTLTYDVTTAGSVVDVRFAGELDFTVVPDVLDRLTAVVLADPRPERVVVNLTELSFLDSTGIHALVTARRIANQHGVTMNLVNPRGMVRRALEITGVLQHLNDPPPTPA
jgi:anti-sigma B factor antagonist